VEAQVDLSLVCFPPFTALPFCPLLQHLSHPVPIYIPFLFLPIALLSTSLPSLLIPNPNTSTYQSTTKHQKENQDREKQEKTT
jgi:hypothetical protein